MGIRGFTKALVVVGFSAFSSMASADFIQTFEGNDCSGVFGQGFANCKIPANIDPNETPIIIKFNSSQAAALRQRSIPRCSRRSTAASSASPSPATARPGLGHTTQGRAIL